MNNYSYIFFQTFIALTMILNTNCYNSNFIHRSISMPNMNNIYYNITHINNNKIVTTKNRIIFINDKNKRKIYLRKRENSIL